MASHPEIQPYVWVICMLMHTCAHVTSRSQGRNHSDFASVSLWTCSRSGPSFALNKHLSEQHDLSRSPWVTQSPVVTLIYQCQSDA